MSPWDSFLRFVGLVVVVVTAACALIYVWTLLWTLVDHVRYGRQALAERKFMEQRLEEAKAKAEDANIESAALRRELRLLRDELRDERGSYRGESASLTPTPPPPSGEHEHDQFPSRALVEHILNGELLERTSSPDPQPRPLEQET